MKLYRSALTAGILALGVAACGDDVQVVDPPPPPPPALQVSMNPPSALIAEGGQADFAVAISGGAAGVEAMHTCASSNTGVASVTDTATGCRVTGVAPGNAAITATVTKGELQATATAGIEVGEVVEAQVSIGAIPPSPLAGQVAVTVNLIRNDQTPTELKLLFGDIPVATQTFAVQAAPAEEGPDLQSTQVITFNVDLADGSYDEVTGVFTPLIVNDDYIVTVELFTVEGGIAPSATNSVTTSVANQDVVEIVHLNPGQSVVNNGVRYFGGEDVTFRVIPKMYSGTAPGTIGVFGFTDGASGNAGAGDVSFNEEDDHGGTVEVDAAPYDFVAEYDDNYQEVEDDDVDDGHSIFLDTLEDADGVDLSGLLTDDPMDLGDVSLIFVDNIDEADGEGVYLDFTPPVVAGEWVGIETDDDVYVPQVLQESTGAVPPATVLPNFYSGGGTWVVTDFVAGVDDNELGSGVDADGAVYWIIIDGDYDNPVPGTTGTDDLDEMGGANPDEQYQVQVNSYADRLGNAVEDLVADIDVLFPAADEAATAGFNVDKGAPVFDEIAPLFGPDFVFSGGGLVDFELADPDLADGEDGAGVDVGSVNTLGVLDGEDPPAVDIDGAVGIVSEAGGVWEIDVDGAGDGAWSFTITAPDLSIEANESEQVIEFILDQTMPDLQLDETPTSTTTSAASVLRNISGTVEDDNGVDTAASQVTVYWAVNGLGVNACDTGAVLDPDLDEIDDNDISLDSESFDVSFRIFNPGAPADIAYCALVEAHDVARDNQDDPDANVASEETLWAIDWIVP